MKPTKYILLLAALLLGNLAASAEDFEVDGIYYNITSETDLTVEVTYRGTNSNSYPDEYIGEVAIPGTATYNGNTYRVTSVGSSAFYGCKNLTAVTIPEGVTSIGSSAFYGCSSLASITIPESVTNIGNSAFGYCSSLTSITIPEGVTSIGGSAFSGCSSLTAITIPESVTSIGDHAFYDCDGLTSITLPEGVTSIGEGAFGDCDGLTAIVVEEGNNVYDSRGGCNAIIETSSNTLTHGCSATIIPESVTSIGDFAFYDCESLTSITIPASVTNIGNYAFYDCESLTSITIPEGVTSIGSSAFYGCSSLASITIPESVTNIGNSAFGYCSSLTSITIPEGVTSIGGSAFSGCSSLTSITIPEGVTSIGGSAFSGCSSLTAITIPESVTSIGDFAFYDCESLTSITLPESSQLTSIGEYAFYYCSSLTAFIISESVTSIGNSAFSECSSLTAITCEATIPPTIKGSTFYNVDKSIPVYVPTSSVEAYKAAAYWSAFTNIQPIPTSDIASGTCGDNLTWRLTEEYELIIEGTGEMYDYEYGDQPWYEYSGSIQSISLSEGMTSIGNYAFYSCTRLTAINIPESVTSIGNYAFYSCTRLTAITIPEGVTSIGWNAFSDCTILTAITVAEGNAVYDSRGGCNAIIETNSNTLIAGCSATIIPEGVTSIGLYAFYACSGLTAITLPESVTSIGDYAFQFCSSLISLTIPMSTTSIGEAAFSCCSSLTSIIVTEGNTIYDSREGCNAIIETSSNTLVFGCSTTIIPESVTSIGRAAFSRCYNLASIIIPKDVTSIGNYAFDYCSSLTSITCEAATPPTIDDPSTFVGVDKSIPVYVPAGSVEAYQSAEYWNKFTNIKGVVASGTCGDNLTWKLTEEYELIIEGTGEMYDYTQGGTPWSEYRDAILTITLPEGMTRIGHWAFSDCTSVTTITVPASVTSIGYGILMGCTNLTSIAVEEGNTIYDSRNGCNAIIKTSNNTLVSGCSATVIPEGVTSIGNRAFGYCTFTTIDIPEGVTSIGDYAFGYCSSLATIILPESMTTIGTGAFVGCRKLAELTCLATTPPTLGSNTTFGNVNKSIPVYVPAASVVAYQSAAYWSEFTNILPIEEPTPDYVTITISKYGSGTYSSAYALDFSEVQGLKAYVATGYNYHTGVVTLLRVHTADAATGLLVKGTPGASYEVPVMEYTADRTLNMMVATLERTEVDSLSSDGVYANYKYTVDPAQNPDEPQFYPFVDNSHLSAGKAYLQIPVAWLPATGQKSIRYRFDEGETTDIEDEEIRNQKSEIIYDLMGRRVLSPKKGEIYIINNQKIVY